MNALKGFWSETKKAVKEVHSKVTDEKWRE